MPLPVTLDDAKAQLRIDVPDQDTEIEGYILDAAAWVEGYTGHTLTVRDVVETHASYVGAIEFPLRAWPIISVAFKAVDRTGNSIVFSPAVDLVERPAMVSAASTPGIYRVIATITAGYEHANDVPRAFRQAMLLLIAAYDADREGGETLAVAEAAAVRLCRRYKRHTL